MQAFLFFNSKSTYFFRFFLPIAILLLAACHSSKELPKDAELPIFLIPAGYQGTLNVVYGQKCGIKPEMENGHPLFRFSKDGFLILQENDLYYSRSGAAYYFVDSAGNRQQISQVIDLDLPPALTTGNKDNKNDLGKGNTTFEKYQKNQPVFVIRGMSVHFLEPLQYVNNKMINGEGASFAHMQYSVFPNGNLDTAVLVSKMGDGEVVKDRVRACKERFEAATKTQTGR